MFNFFKKNKSTENIQRENNKQIIDALTQAGSKTDKEHPIELAFFGDWKKMNLLKDKLISDGYEQVLGQTDQMLVVSKWLKLDLNEINNLTDKTEMLAKQFGVGFDGWSTYPVK